MDQPILPFTHLLHFFFGLEGSEITFYGILKIFRQTLLRNIKSL